MEYTYYHVYFLGLLRLKPATSVLSGTAEYIYTVHLLFYLIGKADVTNPVARIGFSRNTARMIEYLLLVARQFYICICIVLKIKQIEIPEGVSNVFK